MKYFEYIFFIVFLCLCLGPIVLSFRSIKKQYFFRLVQRALLLKSKNDFSFLPTDDLKKIVQLLLAKKQKLALAKLCDGDIKPAVAFLKKHKKTFLNLVLQTIFDARKACPKLKKFIREKPKYYPALLYLAYVYLQNGEKEKALLCLNNIAPEKLKKISAAQALYLQAFFDLDDGNMLPSSQKANTAAKIFKKNKAFFEEAQTYCLLGVIYRTAIICDVAQMMFDTALKIFKNQNLVLQQADAYGNLGMLMAIQQRFAEADDYYQKALEIFSAHRKYIKIAEIYNQQALLLLMQNDLVAAQNTATKALQQHQKHKELKGVALSYDILAQIAWNRKNFDTAFEQASLAKEIYLKNKNYSAAFECMHLLALSLFSQEKFDEAEKILRQITKKNVPHFSNFHTANAYNLLGLIYLQKKDLDRAKALFNQSLDLEQFNNRLSGIATDYANIGLVEMKCGNFEQAQKTIHTALEYAKANHDDELVELINKNFNLKSEG